AEDGIRDKLVTGVQTCALPISPRSARLRCFAARLCSCGHPTPARCHHTGAAIGDQRSSDVPTLNIDNAAIRLRQSLAKGAPTVRSEERRVGKECRCRWWACALK